MFCVQTTIAIAQKQKYQLVYSTIMSVKMPEFII